MTDDEFRVPVAAEDSRVLTELALKVRVSARAHSRVKAPSATSNFARMREYVDLDLIPLQARRFLDAAFEHLVLWADHTAPQKFHPEQTTSITLRPYYTLARAAVEASAHAVWLLGSTSEREVLRRHVCLSRWDLAEQRKWHADPAKKREIADIDAALVKRCGGVFEEGEISPPNGYLDVLRKACSVMDLDVVTVERQWRAASGAAHGKLWLNSELLEDAGPVGFEGILIPRMPEMLNFIDVGVGMARWGALRFAEWSGADTWGLLAEAVGWIAEHGTLVDGAQKPRASRSQG